MENCLTQEYHGKKHAARLSSALRRVASSPVTRAVRALGTRLRGAAESRHRRREGRARAGPAPGIAGPKNCRRSHRSKTHTDQNVTGSKRVFAVHGNVSGQRKRGTLWNVLAHGHLQRAAGAQWSQSTPPPPGPGSLQTAPKPGAGGAPDRPLSPSPELRETLDFGPETRRLSVAPGFCSGAVRGWCHTRPQAAAAALDRDTRVHTDGHACGPLRLQPGRALRRSPLGAWEVRARSASSLGVVPSDGRGPARRSPFRDTRPSAAAQGGDVRDASSPTSSLHAEKQTHPQADTAASTPNPPRPPKTHPLGQLETWRAGKQPRTGQASRPGAACTRSPQSDSSPRHGSHHDAVALRRR